MADQPRRRMSRHVSLVLLSALPGLAGCGGEPEDEVEEVEVLEEVSPPDGPAHLIGGPFLGWWVATHPPQLVRRMVPRAASTTGGRSGPYRSYPRGRSGLFSSPGSSSHAGSSSGVTRGGFGSSGHSAAGG